MKRRVNAMRTTAIIPIFNEEQTISGTISQVRPYVDDILVVVAKKSTDKGLEIARREGAKTLVDNGRGKGAAMRLAANNADGDILLFIDADGSHVTADIPAVLEPIKKGRADMVIASRMLGGSEELYGTLSQFTRMFLSGLITLITNYRFGVRVTDSQNGFRAIRKEVMQNLQLKANIFDIETEMTMKCAKNKYRISEVPSKELKRKHGESGINILKMGPTYIWRVFANLF